MESSTAKTTDAKVTEKLLDLNLINNIKESNLYINYLNTQIKFYENQIQLLKENKPHIFQRKELKNYNNQIDEYKQKVKANYKKIENEFKSIAKIHEKLKY